MSQPTKPRATTAAPRTKRENGARPNPQAGPLNPAYLHHCRVQEQLRFRAALQIVLRHAVAWLQRNWHHPQAQVVAAHLNRVAPHSLDLIVPYTQTRKSA